jgi:hypothetical protein
LRLQLADAVASRPDGMEAPNSETLAGAAAAAMETV